MGAHNADDRASVRRDARPRRSDLVLTGMSRRLISIAAALAACSTPTKVDDTVAPPSSGATGTGSTSFAAALEPTALVFVSVPALAPAAGTIQIGLELVDEVGALSPAGDVLALAGGTRGVQLIHVPQARGLAHRADLTCQEPSPAYVGPCIPKLAFAADGRRLAVWWPELGKLVVLGVPDAKTHFEAAVTEVSTLTFLDDGRLAVAHGDRMTTFAAGGQRHELVRTADLEGHTTVDFVGQISRDGRLIVVKSIDTLRIVDLATRRVHALPASLDLDDVVFGRDGQSFVGRTNGEWPDIVTWREGERTARTLASSREARARPYSLGVRGFAFPPPYDRVFVSTTSPDEVLAVGLDGVRSFGTPWQGAPIEPGDVVARDGVVVFGPTCPTRVDLRGALIPGPILCAYTPVGLAFGPDRLHARTSGGNVLTLDPTTGHLIASHSGALPVVGSTLAMVERDPTLARRVEQAATRAGLDLGKLVTLRLSRDARTVFFVSGGGITSTTIVDLSSGRVRRTLPNSIVSEDGRRLAVMVKDELVDVRTVDGDRVVRTLEVPSASVSELALSSDGRWLMAANNDTLVFEVETGRKTMFPCRRPAVLSPDAKRLACSVRGAVELYELTRPQPLRTIRLRPDATADSLAFSADGRRLAIGAGNLVVVEL